jgi:hypothetical protein
MANKMLFSNRKRKTPKIIILDMDSSESPTYGDQELWG